MNIVEKIKESSLYNNVFIRDIFYAIKWFSNDYKLKKLLQRCENTDSILNYKEFVRVVREIKQSKLSLVQHFYGAESTYYGHLSALYRYANVKTNVNYRAFPKLEHGVNPMITEVDEKTIKEMINFVYQGDYKREQIHSINPTKPVHVIGPYVHYARSIYDEKKMAELKLQWGKTLLVFPFHSCEMDEFNNEDEKLVDYVMNVLAKDFDTVLVSVYWNDVDDKMYKLFENKGAKLVSSGFRGDIYFIDRLKTLLSLADVVCGNAFGTHIGYSIYMGKAYWHIDSTKDFVSQLINLKEYEKKNYIGINEFVRENFKPYRDNQYENKIVKFYEYLWGGERYIKKPEEIKAILDAGEKHLKESKGFIIEFDRTVNEVVNE